MKRTRFKEEQIVAILRESMRGRLDELAAVSRLGSLAKIFCEHDDLALSTD